MATCPCGVLPMNCVLIKCYIGERMVVLCHSWVLKMLGRGEGNQGCKSRLAFLQLNSAAVSQRLFKDPPGRTTSCVTLTSSQVNLNSHYLSLLSIWKQRDTVSKRSCWASTFPGRKNGPGRPSPTLLPHADTAGSPAFPKCHTGRPWESAWWNEIKGSSFLVSEQCWVLRSREDRNRGQKCDPMRALTPKGWNELYRLKGWEASRTLGHLRLSLSQLSGFPLVTAISNYRYGTEK